MWDLSVNALTNARSNVGAYPFTTTEPHLGALYEFVLADIPGLISGASQGKGLGHKFLRHVERTHMLLHCISLEEEEPYAAYTTIRTELHAHNPELSKKDEWIVLTKSDLAREGHAHSSELVFKEHGHTVHTVSTEDEASIKDLRDALVQHLRKGA